MAMRRGGARWARRSVATATASWRPLRSSRGCAKTPAGAFTATGTSAERGAQLTAGQARSAALLIFRALVQLSPIWEGDHAADGAAPATPVTATAPAPLAGAGAGAVPATSSSNDSARSDRGSTARTTFSMRLKSPMFSRKYVRATQSRGRSALRRGSVPWPRGALPVRRSAGNRSRTPAPAPMASRTRRDWPRPPPTTPQDMAARRPPSPRGLLRWRPRARRWNWACAPAPRRTRPWLAPAGMPRRRATAARRPVPPRPRTPLRRRCTSGSPPTRPATRPRWRRTSCPWSSAVPCTHGRPTDAASWTRSGPLLENGPPAAARALTGAFSVCSRSAPHVGGPPGGVHGRDAARRPGGTRRVAVGTGTGLRMRREGGASAAHHRP